MTNEDYFVLLLKDKASGSWIERGEVRPGGRYCQHRCTADICGYSHVKPEGDLTLIRPSMGAVPLQTNPYLLLCDCEHLPGEQIHHSPGTIILCGPVQPLVLSTKTGRERDLCLTSSWKYHSNR